MICAVSIDPTCFIVAALMHPVKTENVDFKTMKKRFKEKPFAKGQ